MNGVLGSSADLTLPHGAAASKLLLGRHIRCPAPKEKKETPHRRSRENYACDIDRNEQRSAQACQQCY
jgi:hypothetical protein